MDKKILALIGIIAILIVAYNSIEPRKTTIVSEDWQGDYIMQAKQDLADYEYFVMDTPYYDYTNPIIVEAANEIKAKSSSAEEAVSNTLKYVYDNMDYVYGEADAICLSGTAPKLLASGKGQCDTQGVVVLSILRYIGLASRPAAGCVLKKDCGFQALYTEEPKTSEINLEGDIFSRGGGLHAWTMVYLPSKGWVSLEETNGKFADLNCYNYHVELLPTNNQLDLFCISRNYNYALSCKTSDLVGLNNNGLGLVQEVLS